MVAFKILLSLFPTPSPLYLLLCISLRPFCYSLVSPSFFCCLFSMSFIFISSRVLHLHLQQQPPPHYSDTTSCIALFLFIYLFCSCGFLSTVSQPVLKAESHESFIATITNSMTLITSMVV